ncbi:MAG: hypothetical protein SangKO_098760 [Sandaracinaceae bacterium]
MVGGGIFAVLGLAVVMAGAGAPLSFLLAGGVALLTASSYATLTGAYPSRGGTVIFVDRAFGVDVVTGALNTLLWLSYIVTLSLYAVAFANYAAALAGSDAGWLWHVLVSVGIVGPAALNLKGAALMSRAETLVVGVKVTILVVVGVVGLSAVQVLRVEPAAWGPLGGVISAGMLMFVAYEGFELIANAAPDVRTPSRTIPRAYFASVGFMTALYVLIAVVTVGTLAPADIQGASDFVLASAGFLVIFAAVNAAAVVLADETGGRRWLAGAGVAACLGALGALVWHTAQTSPGQLARLVGLIGGAFAVEVVVMAGRNGR